MRKMLLIAAAAALLAPAAALATKPPHPPQAKNDSKSSPTALYILRGTLAPTYDVSDPTKLVSIGITVMSANHDGKALKALSQPLSFTLGPETKVVLHKHVPIATGDSGMIKVRFAKTFDPTDSGQLASFLGTVPVQAIDQGTHAYSGKSESNSHASTRLYVLHGTLQGYTPTPGAVPGTVVLTIAKANHDGGVLKDATLPFAVDSSTKLGPAKATWTAGDRVIVKVLGPKTALGQSTDLAGTAKQVIDQGR